MLVGGWVQYLNDLPSHTSNVEARASMEKSEWEGLVCQRYPREGRRYTTAQPIMVGRIPKNKRPGALQSC